MRVGVGYSDLPDSAAAGRAAVLRAKNKSGRQDFCDLALLFCTARHDQHTLRAAVAAEIGAGTPIYGGGAVGIITNEEYGYAGDQVGVALIWLDGVGIEVLTEAGLLQSEEETGVRLGQALKSTGVEKESPVVLFYNAVDRSQGDVRLMMATWLLKGLEKGLGFLPDLAGAGLQGDHVCSPTELFIGAGLGEYYAMALAFSEELCMDTAVMHGCRPASYYHTVTKAEGPVILEIDGKPALTFLDEQLGSAITPEEYPFFLLFGINHGDRWGEFDENNYASRLCLGIDKERGGVVMFEPDMVAGTEFQIMFRSLDPAYMKPKIEALFDGLDGREPVFALYIDCAGRCAGYGGLDMEDARVVQDAVGDRVPLLGLYTGVEIAQMGGRPRGLDWTGVLCLFSRNASGGKCVRKKGAAPSWEARGKTRETGGASMEALARINAQNVAKILSLDAQSIAIRHELELKRRGFSLLAELTENLRHTADYRSMFISVAQRVNATLNMQKTVVLIPNGEGWFTPSVTQGYTAEEMARLAGARLAIDAELTDPATPVIITAVDDEARQTALRTALGLPYLISAPVVIGREIHAILVTGRMVEQTPYLSRLGRSDAETVQAIAGLMASMLVRQHLDEAEQRAHLMLDATPLCASFWNRDGQILDCNLEAVKMYGLTGKQEYLERFYELSPEIQPDGRPSRELSQADIQQAFREGELVREWMHQRLDGEPIPTEVKLVRMKYKGGDVVISYTRDLRELKRQMAEIERSQQELRIARDKAEESSRAKSNFLANMSHEIRTPMNAIIGMTEVAKNTEEAERIRYCLDKIADASEHLLGVINDILDMSKIDAGKLSLSFSEFSIEEMIGTAVNVIALRAEEKGQKLKTTVDPDVPAWIESDLKHLTQVLTNLLANAVKFTPEEGEIALRLHVEDRRGDRCTLRGEVIDNGIGISQEQQARLFQAFEQADGSISRRFGGTGLGLAISKGIVEALGGRIWVESEDGKGARFQFTVNVRALEPAELDAARADEKESAQEMDYTGLFAGRRILLVEDIEINREIVIALLEETDITIDCAENGRIACEMFAQHPDRYDMILMDIQMPEMDGYTATRTIRAMETPRAGTIPIIAMTANVFREDIEKCIEAGMNGHVGKPLDIDEVIEVLRENLL